VEEQVEFKEAIADPTALGITSFGLSLFVLSFYNAGIVGANALSVIVPMALMTALIHFFAMWYGFRKNELFTAVVFGIYGMFWACYALINIGVASKLFTIDATTLLLFLIAYTIFTFYVFIATFVTNKIVIYTLFVLLATFILLDIGAAGYPKIFVLGGYVGMLDGLLALYISAMILLNTMYGKTVLPAGELKR
jgi:uncharacterized protein